MSLGLTLLLFASIGVVSGSPQPASEARHDVIAAIVANLKQFYFDRAIGHRLGDDLLVHEKNGDYESLDRAQLAARINADIQTAGRGLGIARGVFVADVLFSLRPL